MVNILRTLSLLALSVSLVACADDDIGPCVHIMKDPILTIVGATEAPGGATVSELMIDSVLVDGDRRSNSLLITPLGFSDDTLSFGLDTVDGRLRCTPPCAFNGDEGEWALYINTPGYRDTVITVDASFDTFNGGCPSSVEDGEEIEVVLGRE